MTDDLLKRCMAIQGWMGEEELRWLSEQASKSRILAEVGCWKGRTSLCLAESTSGVLFCVDHFDGSEEHQEEFVGKSDDWLSDEWCRNTMHMERKVVAIVEESVVAAEVLLKQGIKFDMVFLDASHSYVDIAEDIIAWSPLVMRGGILCGHDHGTSWPGVVRAVDELLPDRRLLEPTSRCSIWWVVL